VRRREDRWPFPCNSNLHGPVHESRKAAWSESTRRLPKALHSRTGGESAVCLTLSKTDSRCKAEIQLIIDLLKFTAFFWCQPNSAVNFSLLQAVTSWIQEALRLAPVHLPDISRSAELLSRAVASTSGLGLNDMWSSWTSSINPNSYSLELEQATSDADDSEEAYSGSHSPRNYVHVLIPYPVLRTQLLEHIVTRYLKTGTYPSTDVNSENDVPIPSDLELVGYYVIYHP